FPTCAAKPHKADVVSVGDTSTHQGVYSTVHHGCEFSVLSQYLARILLQRGVHCNAASIYVWSQEYDKTSVSKGLWWKGRLVLRVGDKVVVQPRLRHNDQRVALCWIIIPRFDKVALLFEPKAVPPLYSFQWL